MQILIVTICIITIIILLNRVIDQQRSWGQNMMEWTQNEGFHFNKGNLGRLPSFSGLHKGYNCTIELIPLGLGTEIVFLCTRIEVFMKNDAQVLSFPKFGGRIRVKTNLEHLDKYYHNLVHNLLISIEFNRNLLAQLDSQLILFPNKISYTLSGANIEADRVRYALDNLSVLARQIDQITVILESVKNQNI